MTLEADMPNNLISHILSHIIPNIKRVPTNTYTYSGEYPPNFDFINEHFFKCTMTENKFDALYQLINNAFLNRKVSSIKVLLVIHFGTFNGRETERPITLSGFILTS